MEKKKMNISLMNIQRQHADHAGEIETAALEVLRSGGYIGGRAVEEFEADFAAFCRKKFAVSVANGTDALVIALRGAGIGPGDEVITVSCSFFATSEAICSVGATPVFIDVCSDTYCMNPDLIEDAVTEKTKAILTVHFYGHSADMDRINAVAKKHRLLVFEDCAQAAGTYYKGRHAGSMSDAGCFSFYPTKSLGADGDGGIIVTDNEEIAHACEAYKLHGSGVNGFEVFKREYERAGRALPSGIEFGATKYHNYLIGYNSRLDAIQAAILGVKLKYLPEYVGKRRDNAKYYNEMLKSTSLDTPFVASDCEHSYYLYVLHHQKAGKFIAKLRERGVGCDTYYPIPLHLQGAFAYLGYHKGDFPVTESISKETFAIPVFPELTEEEREYIANTVMEVEREIGR
ncbi:MAG: DegT/DnrJ/EryC1/StrS family aminotransferase [Christensenella sp.]|nr:DegT/DnrJ/EryC1/StrS family aminotransferase [Christensenella sp.]